MADSTAETLYDYISDETGKAVATGNSQNKVASHREFKINATDGDQQLYLSFDDKESGKYNIPLGTVSSHEKSNSSDHQNIIVPVVPVTYTTADLDPKNARIPRSGGYIYIFNGDYLWRELEVLKNGKYTDVNLHTYQGKDVRAATVESDTRILMPYKIDGESETLTICYSEIQWSWSRINAMGGMNPDDFRIDKKNPPLLAEACGITKGQAEDTRIARMQEVDLSGYESSFPNTIADGNKARIEDSNYVTSTEYLLKAHSASCIPVVYLHDPIGIAHNNVAAYYEKHSELVAAVENIKADEYYKSGVIAYHTMFNKKLWDCKPPEGRHGPIYDERGDAAKLFRQSAREIDRTFLEETTLLVTRRKLLRQQIRELKKEHVEWLEGKFKGKKLIDTNSDLVSINDVMVDYAELPTASYTVLWSAMSFLIHFLNHDPSRLDAAFDLHKNQDRLKPADDPGVLYMNSLLETSHPLNAILFPKKSDVDEYKKDYDIGGKKIEAPNGTGEFRPVAFAASMATLLNKPTEGWKQFDSAIKMSEKILADFSTAFKPQWQLSFSDAAKTGISVNADAIFRLIKSANLPDLKDMHLIKPGDAIPSSSVIISGNVSVFSQILRAQNDGIISKNKPKGKNAVSVLEPDTKNIIGYIDPKQIPNNKGMPLDINKAKWEGLFSKGEQGAKTSYGKLAVVAKNSAYAKNWHFAFKGDVGEAIAVDKTPKGIRFAGKYLPPIIAVLEVFNLASAASDVRKTVSKKNIAKFLLSGVGLAHASITASIALIGEERTANFMQRGLGNIGKNLGKKSLEIKLGNAGKFMVSGTIGRGTGFKVIGVAGATLSGLGAGMSAWDSYDAFMADDDDAGVALAVSAMAMTAVTITAFVEVGVIFLGMGPIGWAFLAVGILAGIMATIFTDTPLEKWAKHGPFSKEIDARMTAELAKLSKDSAGNQITVAKSGQETLEALMNLLMTPSITMTKDTEVTPNKIIVKMLAPGFVVGKNTLEIYTTVSTIRRHRGTSTLSNEKPISPSDTENIVDVNTKAVLGFKYTYDIPAGHEMAFKTRGRHITSDQIFIPKKIWHAVNPPGQGGGRMGRNKGPVRHSSKSSIYISKADKSWVYPEIKFVAAEIN